MGTICIFVTQFVLIVNCEKFPCKGNGFSIVSVKFHTLAAHHLLVESMSDCRCVKSVAELTARNILNILILLTNENILNV